MCIGMLQVIRSVNDTLLKEVLKEYFRLIGCLYYDQPCGSPSQALTYVNRYAAQKGFYNIVIQSPSGLPMDFLPGDFRKDVLEEDCSTEKYVFAGRWSTVVYLRYPGIPDDGMRGDFFRDVIDQLIDILWTGQPNSNLLVKQLKRIAELYFDYDLFSYIQSKRALRSIRPGEIIATDRKKGKVPVEAETSNYLAKMFLSFNKVRNILTQEFPERDGPEGNTEDAPSFYVRYAQVTLARKNNDLYNLLDRLPAIDEDNLYSLTGRNGNPLFAPSDLNVSFHDPYMLLQDLWAVEGANSSYPGIYFLSASLCLSETALENYVPKYLGKLLKATEGVPLISAFAYYIYGSYLSSTRNNWDAGIIYFRKALQANPLDYRAQYKLGVYAANQKNADIAIQEFMKTARIIVTSLCGKNSVEEISDNISSRCMLYLFKTYCYIWLLAKNYRSDTTLPNIYYDKMRRVLALYQANRIMDQFYGAINPNKADTDPVYIVYRKYHDSSYPLKLMKERCSELR